MSLELFNSLATFGTFLVIAATAIAALIQLRHARSANLIEGLSEVQRTFNTPEFAAAQTFVLTELASKWQEPDFRYQVVNRGSRTPENQGLIAKTLRVGNTFENLGAFVRRGLIDREMALGMFDGVARGAWEKLAPVNVTLRRTQGDTTWEDFEYFVVLAQDWAVAHPHGMYPRDVRRIEINDALLEADAHYAATRGAA